MRLYYKVQERQRIVGELEQNLTVSQELCDTLDREVSMYNNSLVFWYSFVLLVHVYMVD